jgi:3'-5' exoribonuclease
VLPIDLYDLTVGSKVSGLLYVQSYTKKPEGTVSKAPLNGSALFQGKSLTFKMWDHGLQNIFNTNELTGSIIQVVADVGTYLDKLELTLQEIKFDHGFNNVSAFFKSVDVDAVFAKFVEFVNTNMSQTAVNILMTIFNSQSLFDPFKVTWAGSKMHDAQVGGLMNHTLKMLRIAKTLVENDPRLEPWADMIYLNIVLHDIGKVGEIGVGGVYTDDSFVSHRAMGAEITVQNKAAIVAAYGTTYYYHIIAVQLGHHGEFADKPTTIWAYLIHLIDMLEAHTTSFLDKMSTGDFKIKNGQKTIWTGEGNLVV